MNPIELGQGTFPLSEAATDRFAIMVNIGYLAPAEEQKLVNFDFKKVRLDKLMPKERIIHLRSSINSEVFLHERLSMYRGLRADTIARFGQARYDEYDQLYAFFVGLVESGKVGGARLSGRADRGIS